MTAAQIKKALKSHGLRVVLEKDPTCPGSWEYLVSRITDDATVVSGWSLGSKTDAYRCAYGACGV